MWRVAIAFWLLTMRLFRRWPTLRNDAKLSEQTEVVPNCPVLGYPAFDDSVDSHTLPRHVSASRRDRSPRRMKDLTCVSAGRCDQLHDKIVLCNFLIDLHSAVGESGLDISDDPLHGLDAVFARNMVQEVWS